MKKKKSEASRRILIAAANVFSEFGFAGARVNEIARRAGVNKATIYYHIGDKKVLYAEVLRVVFGNIAKRMDSEIDNSKDPAEKLRSYIQSLERAVDEYPQMSTIMLREVASCAQTFPESVALDLGRILGYLTDILNEGIEQGVFVETEPYIVHMMITGTIMIYKASGSIGSGNEYFINMFDVLNENVFSKVGKNIEELIIKAVKK